MVRGLSLYRDDYLFHKCHGIFFIFSHVPSASENIQEYFSHKWNKFDIQLQNIEFSIYYIFFGVWTCFFFLRYDCNTWPEVTIADHFHIEKITLLIFSQCENNSLWRYLFCSIDILTRYFTAENVITVYNIQCNNCV